MRLSKPFATLGWHDETGDGARCGTAAFSVVEMEPVVTFTQTVDGVTNTVTVPRDVLVVAYVDGWDGELTSDAVRAALL